MVTRRSAGIVIAFGAVLMIAAGVAVPLFVKAHRQEQIAGCARNMLELYKTWQTTLPIVGRGYKMPDTRGKEFWAETMTRSATATSPPLWSLVRCPIRQGTPGEVHYLGPSDRVSRRSGTDPVGCDEEFNHSSIGATGGNILLKNGDVVEDRGDLWRKVLGGLCIP